MTSPRSGSGLWSGAAAYGLYRWKKAKGCACQLTEGTNGNGAANGNGNGNGNTNANGSNGNAAWLEDGNGSNGKATLNLPNLPNQGRMAPTATHEDQGDHRPRWSSSTTTKCEDLRLVPGMNRREVIDKRREPRQEARRYAQGGPPA
ncbi:MAG: hypothetical protein R3A51_10530 [Nannocystaceae bacterium]